MKELLIYLENPADRDELEDLFRASSWKVDLVDDEEQCLQKCQAHLYDAVLIWRATPERVAALCKRLTRRQLDYLPLIPVVANEVLARDILGQPVVDLLILPMPRFEFFHLLDQLVAELSPLATATEDTGWYGRLAEYTIVDLLQMMERMGRSGRIRISALGTEAILLFEKGTVQNVQLGPFEGLVALEKLAFLEEGHFQVKYLSPGQTGGGAILQKENLAAYLKEKRATWQAQYTGLPEPMAELLANPFHPPKGASGLEAEIYRFFQKPAPLGEVLLRLPDPMDQMIAALQRLMRNGQLGPRRQVEQLIAEEEKKGALSRVVGALFRRKEYRSPFQQQVDRELRSEPPELPKAAPVSLDASDRAAIQGFLKEAENETS